MLIIPFIPTGERAVLLGSMEVILENLTEAVTIADADGTIVLRNRAAREILDVETGPQGSVLSPCPYRLLYLDGSPVPSNDYPVKKLLRGETVQNLDLIIERWDGTERNVRLNGRVVSNSGAPAFAVLTYTDITETVRYREQQEDYVRAVSHDLRNPLSALLAQAQMLEMDTSRKGLSEENRAVQVILKNGRRLNAMLEDLIQSLRMDSGLDRLRFEKTDLRDLLHDVYDRHSGPAGDTTLELRLPGTPCWSKVDRNRIERCLENLLANAIQYSPPGSPVTLSLEAVGDRAIITVTDRGSGIAPEHLPRIFDRFYRADSTYARGLGLGLYIVKLAVEAHGGSVSVESKVGEGSTFTISLPLA